MTGFSFAGAATPEHIGPIPAQADVVVIGGGIAGVNTAWHLRQRGLRVVLLEKGRVGAEQSGRNWGWIRVQGRDLDEIPLVLEAQRLWADWAERLGPGLGYRVCGVSYLARSEAEMAGHQDWLQQAAGYGLTSHLLGPQGVAALFPDARPGHWAGALHTPADACAEPFVAVPMMARALAQAGAVVVEHCAVRALDMQAGRVVGVVTEAGRIAAPAVVLAGGAWSSLFLRAQGVDIPQLAVLSSVAATAPMPAFFAGAAVDDQFALRRRADGGYTIAAGDGTRMFLGPDVFRHALAYRAVLPRVWRGLHLHPAAPRGFPDAWTTPRHWDPGRPGPFEAMRVLNPAPHAPTLARVARHFAHAFPGQPAPRLHLSWAGLIDTLPDVVPILDHVPALPGLVLGTGLSGHGFGIGPAVGRVLGDLVLGNDPGHDLHRFRFGRFADGSTIRPGPGL